MINRMYNSIVFRIGSLMFIISFVAILSMFSSVFISELADNDALAINHAGSIRMQSYKVLSGFEFRQLMASDNPEAKKISIQASVTELDRNFIPLFFIKLNIKT